jgi:nucleoside phosphorylase
MIAVTFALPAESSEFIRLLRNRAAVSVIQTGVGRGVAEQRVRAALSEGPLPSSLISAGFAGGLDDELRVGDLFLAQNFSDGPLLAKARSALAQLPHHVGTMATADTIVDSPADRANVATQSGAAAIDMETESIRAACSALGVPMLSLRVISDTPASPLPAPPAVLFDVEQQRTRFAPLAVYLLKNPVAIGRLIGFANHVALCRRRLAAALDLVLQTQTG